MSQNELSLYIAKAAIDLHSLLKNLTKQHVRHNDYRVICYPSMRIIGDVVQQWDLELRQLERWQSNGIRPTKSIASLSFWIKKLKPVRAFAIPKDLPTLEGMALPCLVCGADSPPQGLNAEQRKAREQLIRENFEYEIGDINERLAIFLAIYQLVDYVTGKEYIKHRLIVDNNINGDPPHFNKADIQIFLLEYFHQKLGNGDSTIYDSLIFNMRYRTFASHHLVHILDQILFSLTHNNDKKKRKNKAG